MDAAALEELCQHQWYDALESVIRRQVAAGDGSAALARAGELAGVAHRVMSLDAEDFHQLAQGHHGDWAQIMVQASFPHEPRAKDRGALGSLLSLYELMLEVVNLRAARGEPQSLVVTAHLIGEYLCQLAWEPRLGHAGDPARMPDSVGERWGTDDKSCAHNSAMRATAKRSLNAARGDQSGFTSYLDKFHSRLGDTLAVCAMNHQTIEAGDRPDVGPTCAHPCGWVLQGSLAQRRALDARLRLALIYLASPLVALRHHAPVGHFFGVPSMQEISQGWLTTWQKLTAPWPDGSNPLLAALKRGGELTEPGEALPGLSLLVSVVADREVRPSRVLPQLGADITTQLRSWEQGGPR